MQIISNPTQVDIKKAAQVLKDGHLVAFPTETVYGLGADATNENAIGRMFSAKDRPLKHPVIVHVSSITQIESWVVNIPNYAIELAEEFWPGPMTLILERSELAKDSITGGQNCIGIRIPNHPLALSFLKEFESLGGIGIVAPSANRFGSLSPTTAKSVYEELNDFLDNEHLILDGGQCLIGIESTIISCLSDTPIILRPGAISVSMINEITNRPNVLKSGSDAVKFSGSLNSHYAPKAKLMLSGTPKSGEGLLALESVPTPLGVIRLAAPKTIEQFAFEMYEALRSADRQGIDKIVVIAPQGTPLADAIYDRLFKASFKNY